MKKQILLVLMIIILSFSVLGDVEYNFLTANQINTQPTNNTVLINGNYNNTHLVIGNINSTVRKISISTLTDAGVITGLPCATTNYLLKSITKFSDNTTLCLGYNTPFYNATGNVINIAIGSTFVGYTYFNGTYYLYHNGGNGILFEKNKLTTNGLTYYPALTCYNDLNNVFINNFGMNISLIPNQLNNVSISDGTIIQDETTFYFKLNNRWFYLDEDGSNSCAGIAYTLNEATITLPSVTTTSNVYQIINSDLYINSKDGNTFYAFTSGDVDVYNGLTCTTDKTYCINASKYCLSTAFGDNLCNSTYMLGNGSNRFDYCDSNQNKTFCSGGCVNSPKINLYGVTYHEGTCTQLNTCTNECDTLGDVQPNSLNSFNYCDLDIDTGCLYYLEVNCNVSNNEIAVGGNCITTNNVGVETSLYGFNVVINDTYVKSKNENVIPKTAQLETDLSYLNQKFKVTSIYLPYYLARTCNYTSTNLYSDVTPRTINTSQEVNLTSYTNGIYTLNLLPDADTGVLIEAFDILGSPVYKYYVERNTSQGTCLYIANDTNNRSVLQACSLYATDILQSILIEVQTLNKASSVHLYLTRTNTVKDNIYTSFLDYTGTTTDIYTFRLTGLYTINKFIITNDAQNNDIAYQNVSVTQYTGNTNNIASITDNTLCQYVTVGCRTVRFYYVNIGSENLFNYRDWYLCVNKLGGVTLKTSTGGLLGKLTDNAKLILSLIIPMITLIIFLAFGFMSHKENEQTAIIWTGILLTVILLILFAIFGWLPVWVLIIAGIIAGLGVGLFFVNKARGQ